MAEIVNFLELNPEILAMNDMYVRGQGWESSFIKDSYYQNREFDTLDGEVEDDFDEFDDF